MTRLKLPEFSSKTRESAVTVLNLTVEALEAGKDTICDVASVPGLGMAFDAAIGILKKVQAAKSNSDALKSLCAEVTSLVDMLQELAKTIEARLGKYSVGSPQRTRAQETLSRSGSELHRRVERLAQELRTICDEAGQLSNRSRFGRFLHSTEDSEAITNMKGSIVAARERFQIEGCVETETLVINALTGIEKVIEAEEEHILQDLRVDQAHYLADANTGKARFQQGTRERLFQQLDKWVEECVAGRAFQPVFVLVGEAGTGKSTIASQFASRLSGLRYFGGTFFFTRGVQDLNSPRKVFATLASQLARSQPALRMPVLDAAREHRKVAAVQHLEVEFEDFFRKPLSDLSKSQPDHPLIFVLLDALDECTEEGPELVPKLLEMLLSVTALPRSPLRIFLTSRPEPHYIHDALTTPSVKHLISTISIQTFRDSVDRDIELLITRRETVNPHRNPL